LSLRTMAVRSMARPIWRIVVSACQAQCGERVVGSMNNSALLFPCPGRAQLPAGAVPDFDAVRPSKARLAGLFAAQVPERYAPPRAICWEGDAATHVFHLLEGCLRVYRTTEDGRRAILCFSYPGELLCLSVADTYLFTAEAVKPIRFRRLPRQRFNDLVGESAELRALLEAETCRTMTAAQDQIIRLGRTGADERVATFLLEVAQRGGTMMRAPVEVDLPFGRLDVADYLGLTVETISREISKLKRDGLISTNGPHRIVLRDVRRLREIARMEASLGRGTATESGQPLGVAA
jgi:CRP/FNR family transcriptional regulator, anaerobic regulatory protein